MKRALALGRRCAARGRCLTPPPGPDGFVDPDPYETQNRLFFAFNDGVDRLAFEPLGRLWRFITPRILRTGLDNAFLNMRFPVRVVSCLGQGGCVDRAGSETLRFAVNSTLGVAGLWDPSTRLFEMPVLRRGRRPDARGLGPPLRALLDDPAARPVEPARHGAGTSSTLPEPDAELRRAASPG